ncbi:starch phosphorylase [Ligilactobacillus sp. WC1T17]|uniref:Alpha-1,4 glucan phosphorylase n=1 Tax=Ligilactobacillus ruminis TaxID=1623 RepID=A0ABY1ADZ8_9LACO|nr:starch phosphorylase [Ligilactobacillus ruminis]
MKITTEQFIKEFKRRLTDEYALDVKDATKEELYRTLAAVVKSGYFDIWRKSKNSFDQDQKKQVYYFSIEFLPGQLLKSNLLNMGWYTLVKKAFQELGLDLDEIAQVEPDMALGNGGLGRLASAFMDSSASLALPVNGNGIRYKYGLFKQKFVDGYQVELANAWLDQNNVWEVARPSKAVKVHFGGQVYLKEGADGTLEPVYENDKVILAVPYDTGIVGYKNRHVNTMRLWDAQIPAEEEINFPTIESRRRVEDLTSVLYPDDSNEAGKFFRLNQEYFFVSAGMQSIIRHYKQVHLSLLDLSQYVSVHINDTHPAMCVAELMRILLDDEKLSWEDAWKQTVQVMSYTNHTIMAEALEKWPLYMLEKVQPRLVQIIQEIDRRYALELEAKGQSQLLASTRPVKDNMIYMANLAIIGSHSVNGVAKLHTELLKQDVLKDFYTLYPERFNNKTNGITVRRWLEIANPSLTKTIDRVIGTKWHYDAKELHKLASHVSDKRLVDAIGQVKYQNKVRFAKYVKATMGLEISPKAIFDVQVKRLHAYKRQLLNLLRIIQLYLNLKQNPALDIYPRVFIFGAKAAPSYHYAKSIIKCINEVADLINHDDSLNDKLKVVFVEDYRVSLAEKIIPAADVSEQISTATKEASGTSNMKLMLNGALTVATLDGANIEIKDRVGEDNIFIFGLQKEEVLDYEQNHGYHSADYYQNDPAIHRVLDALVDGSIPHIQAEGREIFDSLVRANDEYFVLRDFEDYLRAQNEVDQLYRNQTQWNKKCLINIANAGYFSSDDTIRNYAEDIWQVTPTVSENGKVSAEDARYPL